MKPYIVDHIESSSGNVVSYTKQEKYKTLGSETWERDSNYKFEFDITQPGNYHVSTCIRHSTDYKQRNISCYLIIRHQGAEVDKENSDIIIVDNNGRWVGQGLTGLKTVVQPIERIFHFDSTGIYIRGNQTPDER